MTTAQVVETSVTVSNNSPIQDYVHPDDQTEPTFIKLIIETANIRLFILNWDDGVIGLNVYFFEARYLSSVRSFSWW